MLRCFWTKAETGNGHDHRGRRVAVYSTAWSPGFDSCSTNAGRVLAWDGWTPVREWRAGADGAESVLDYYWGADLSGAVGGAGGIGGLLAVSLDGAWYAPLYDGCGNVVAYVSEAGAVVAEYRYDAFGNTLSQSGPLADAFPFRFSTKRLDAETGLYDYGLRHYKPSWGRWISRDPAGEDGGPNLYAFCGNDPVNGIDPLGAKGVRLVSRGKEVTSLDDIRLEITGTINGGKFIMQPLEVQREGLKICEIKVPVKIAYNPFSHFRSETYAGYYSHSTTTQNGGEIINAPNLDVIIAHEKGHANGFLQYYPILKRELETYIGSYFGNPQKKYARLTEAGGHGFRLLSEGANTATVQWFEQNGWIRMPPEKVFLRPPPGKIKLPDLAWRRRI